ncbi:MAG: hypothetical protein JW809_04690 [Pirellulales bacterium]|nr:hypothetical protein [Pirellulales bacterium]
MDDALARLCSNAESLALVLTFLVPIVAIVAWAVVRIVKMVIQHCERMEMLRQGINPDHLDDPAP